MTRKYLINKYKSDRGIKDSYKLNDDENYLIDKLLEAINYNQCCKYVKGEQVPTFDEFIDKFNLEADRDNEYFFDDKYFNIKGLYYKYAEYYGIKP